MAEYRGCSRQNSVTGPHKCSGFSYLANWRQILMASKARYLFLILTFVGAPALRAEQPHLTAEDQARLARQFAPVLVFHSAEKFFPASPFFSLDTSEPSADKESTLRRLGTTTS